jgi:hypothetical protein
MNFFCAGSSKDPEFREIRLAAERLHRTKGENSISIEPKRSTRRSSVDVHKNKDYEDVTDYRRGLPKRYPLWSRCRAERRRTRRRAVRRKMRR